MLISVLYDGSSTTSSPTTKQFSSIFYINEQFGADNRLDIPLIKYEKIDSNHDDYIDQFKFQISFYDTPSEIRRIKLQILFSYTIAVNNDQEDEIVSTNCDVDIETPNGASYVKIDGDLNLHQKEPLEAKTLNYGSYYKSQKDTFLDYQKYEETFNKRSVTTFYDYQKIVIPQRTTDRVRIDMTVNIPSFQPILWKTSGFTALKFAFIQYMAMFIPLAVLFKIIMLFIFRSKIFPSTVITDLPKLKAN